MPTASASAPDLAGFRVQLEQLLDGGDREAVVGAVLTLLESVVGDNTRLAGRLQAALRQLYRQKSEKISTEQLALFLAQLPKEDAALAQVASTDATDSQKATTGEAEGLPAGDGKGAGRRGGKQGMPAHLRREVKVIPVAEAERACEGCGSAKQPMGTDPQYLWAFKPAEIYIIEERREVLVCKTCEEGVVTAEGTIKAKDRARPDSSLIAQIITAKLRDCLPLYRQSEIFERSGVRLAPSTLLDWYMLGANLLEPLWQHARYELLLAYLLSLDDTGMPVLDRDHPRGIKRGHIWTYVADQGRVVFCDYSPDWKGSHALAVLADFKGRYIQGDGYAGIDAHFARPGAPQRVGCMDHARRRFLAALDAKDLRAAIPVSLLKQLYAVEREAREAGEDLVALHARRQHFSRPLIQRLHEVIAKLQPNAVPKSPLGKAVTYAVNQWPTLVVFLEEPRLPISNAHVERLQRRTALGRKNYLFAGSDEGARCLAILTTIVSNCELAGAPTFDYLHDVIAKIAAGWPAARIAELMPRPWLLARSALTTAHEPAQQQ